MDIRIIELPAYFNNEETERAEQLGIPVKDEHFDIEMVALFINHIILIEPDGEHETRIQMSTGVMAQIKMPYKQVVFKIKEKCH